MNNSIPAIAIVIPMSENSLAPTLATSACEKTCADDDAGGKGEESEPGLERRIAEHSLQVEVLKKNIAKRPAATKSIATFAARTVRTRRC